MFSYIAAAESPGRSVAIVAEQTALILAELPSEELLTRLLELIRQEGFDGILDELRKHSSPGFEHFALL